MNDWIARRADDIPDGADALAVLVETRNQVERDTSERQIHVVRVVLDRGLGTGTAWGCDLTEGYVKINAEYST